MKPKPFVLVLLAAIAIAAAALVLLRFRSAPKMNPPAEIQDGKTLDFSSGKPVVKDSANEKAIIDAAVKEMDDAVKDVTFAPPPAKPPEKKAPGADLAPAPK